MTEKTICLKIFQPFAQYRNPFTFYYGQTFPLPPKSTIIGMLQNACNKYYYEKFWNLKVSIHGGFESTFWNYQQLIKNGTYIKYTNGNLIITNKNDSNKNMYGIDELPLYGLGLKSIRSPVFQQELFNGHLWIFLRGEESLIDEVEASLSQPKKILSLGRSEDVIFIKKIDEIREFKNKEARKNMWLKYPTYLKLLKDKKNKKFPLKNQKYPVYSISNVVLFKNNGKTIQNKAELTKETKREPEFETVIYTGFDYPVYLDESINVDYIQVEEKTFKIPTEYGWL